MNKSGTQKGECLQLQIIGVSKQDYFYEHNKVESN